MPVLPSTFRYWLRSLKLNSRGCGKDDTKGKWKRVQNGRAPHVVETTFLSCNMSVSTSESGIVSLDQCFTLLWNQIQTDMALNQLWVPWNLGNFKGLFGLWHNFQRATLHHIVSWWSRLHDTPVVTNTTTLHLLRKHALEYKKSRESVITPQGSLGHRVCLT